MPHPVYFSRNLHFYQKTKVWHLSVNYVSQMSKKQR